MLPTYRDAVSGGTATLTRANAYGRGDWLLHYIYVPVSSRGQGAGTRLLSHVTRDADSEGVRLWLYPDADQRPRSVAGLTQSQLVAWYRKYGFQWHDQLNLMMREPQL